MNARQAASAVRRRLGCSAPIKRLDCGETNSIVVRSKSVGFSDLARASMVFVDVRCTDKLDRSVVDDLSRISKEGNFIIRLEGKAYPFGFKIA